jgi:4-diphosphocytidyl-2-C-methyl-D-erythritol kinase
MATDPGFAPAKINLTLHVSGRRADGYHLLDSLVVFADVGDRVAAEPADALSLTVTGPMAAGLDADGGNLVLRAASLLSKPGRGAALSLDKHLPVASGIGGGSSDAAATLRVLALMWDMPLPGAQAVTALGSDVPVCMIPRARRMKGIGETLSDVPDLPNVWLVLVNPGVAVATADVFRGLAKRDNAPMPEALPAWPDAVALASFLRGMRNDLEEPALRVQPEIGKVLAALRASDACLAARMSGSGATCFGLFADRSAAKGAAAKIAANMPRWWVRTAKVL